MTSEQIPLDAVHQYAYCPRRAYLMYRDGEWAENEYIEDGRLVHERVDNDVAALPADSKPNEDEAPLVGRSVELGSDSLGVVAKLDLVETTGAQATPVEYKRGKVPENGERSWPPERIQLMVQGLLLREHGFEVTEGILYFRQSRARVAIPFDDHLESSAIAAIDATHRTLAATEAPAPLVDSPKCPGCSLSGICLPDETALLEIGTEGGASDVRRLFPARDDRVPLYVQEPGSHVGKTGDSLVVRKSGKELARIRMMDISHVALCGSVQISSQAVQRLAKHDIPVTHLSMGHWFYAITHGLSLRSAFTKDHQFACARDTQRSLELSKSFVLAKAANQRTVLMRNGNKDQRVLRAMKREIRSIEGAGDKAQLLGIEGNVAAFYFGSFESILKPRDDLDTFSFRSRNRRPPRDPVNAMLSFGYALLAKDCTVSLLAVGLDPYWGMYHEPRHGRPSLALDLMEEFRPLLVDSAVLTAINTGTVRRRHFDIAAGSCALNAGGRKAFIKVYESRMEQLVTHPVFDYRLSWRRVVAVQARLLSRAIRGEIAEYKGMTTR